MREIFHDRPDVGGLMEEIMKPEENITDFLNRMRERWGQETGQVWANTGPQVTFFYNVLMEGLPT